MIIFEERCPECKGQLRVRQVIPYQHYGGVGGEMLPSRLCVWNKHGRRYMWVCGLCGHKSSRWRDFLVKEGK